MTLTQEQLEDAMPDAGVLARIYLRPLNDAMTEFAINTPLRVASFLGQIAHESASLHYTRELASGEAYDTGPLAARLGNTPAKDGDGERLKGRGLIQITGATNYRRCGLALGRDMLADPAYLETPIGASRSAAWFFKDAGCNEQADVGNFGTITQKINGGFRGLDSRIRHYCRARKALGI